MNEPNTPVLVWQQVIASLRILADRSVQTTALTALLMTMISIEVAPDTDPGAGSWIGLLGIGALAMLAIITWVASNALRLHPADRQHRRTAAVTFAVAALLSNLFFGFWSTALLAAAIIAILRQARSLRPGEFPWLLNATIVTLIPWWIWTALDSWDPGLLMLAPIAALAFLTGQHIREAYAPPPADDRLLSQRGHRYGAWMGMLLGGILVIVAGLVGESDHSWLALGGVTMALAVALEAGSRLSPTHPGRTSAAVSDLAFAVLTVCWLASIS